MDNVIEKTAVKKEVTKKVHTVNIFDREKIDIVGAIEVVSSTETEVIAKVNDFVMVVYGKDLRVAKFVPEEIFLGITGNIDGVKYESKAQKKSFFGKVFK